MLGVEDTEGYHAINDVINQFNKPLSKVEISNQQIKEFTLQPIAKNFDVSLIQKRKSYDNKQRYDEADANRKIISHTVYQRLINCR